MVCSNAHPFVGRRYHQLRWCCRLLWFLVLLQQLARLFVWRWIRPWRSGIEVNGHDFILTFRTDIVLFSCKFREEKRWMERQNERERARMKKEEQVRLNTLVCILLLLFPLIFVSFYSMLLLFHDVKLSECAQEGSSYKETFGRVEGTEKKEERGEICTATKIARGGWKLVICFCSKSYINISSKNGKKLLSVSKKNKRRKQSRLRCDLIEHMLSLFSTHHCWRFI